MKERYLNDGFSQNHHWSCAGFSLYQSASLPGRNRHYILGNYVLPDIDIIIENENIHFDTYGRVNPDVIDVEYTEKEEEQRGKL